MFAYVYLGGIIVCSVVLRLGSHVDGLSVYILRQEPLFTASPKSIKNYGTDVKK